ncbi:ACT domain-containing protein [Anderseniella sp. Alg231-50]|uniref:ACT domain-containing protein n=1 Tax=Anderseniella sp. Alg231-50 TaxID=1922226 RepID=UPI000D54BCFE
MSGETNLNELLKSLSAQLVEGVYVFATLPDDSIPENITPRMVFREAEGITLVLRKTEAEACGLACEFPCRMITLDVHSSLEAVGFIAHIASELARHDMGVNPVSGFFHDHLFVPEGREQDAMRILERIASDST